jgi:hypothetical protein
MSNSEAQSSGLLFVFQEKEQVKDEAMEFYLHKMNSIHILLAAV